MDENYNIYKKFVIVFTIITIFEALITKHESGYEFIAIIPLVYFVCFMFGKNFHKYSRQYSGLLILNGLMFLKYVVTIFVICITGGYKLNSYYVVSVSTSSYYWATIILVGEMISIFLVIELLSGKIYKGRSLEDYQMNFGPIKKGLALIFFIFVSIGLIVLYKEEFFGTLSILFSNENALTESTDINHILSVVFGAFRIIIIGLCINACIVKYNDSKKKRYVVFSYILIGIHCFLSISTSRMNIIIPFFLFVLITSKTFKRTGVYLNFAIVFVLGSILGAVSIYKTPYIITSGSPFIAFFTDFANRLQEYTSNIMPTAIGLQAIEKYGSLINIGTLFTDFFGQIPIVSHAFRDENMIYTIYNMYALGGSSNTQLIPMTVSSIAYFTPIFTYLLVDVCVVLLMFFEKKNNRKSNNYLDSYLRLYLLFIFASCTFSNVQMLSGRLFANYVPAILVLYFNKIISGNYKIVIHKKEVSR